MADILRIPDVIEQEFLTGNDITGVAPVGSPLVDSEETVRRGRYRRFSNLTDGGLVDIAESVARGGYKVRSVLMSLPNVTVVDFYVVDRDGNDVFAGSVTTSATGDGYIDWKDLGLLVAPGCKFKAVGTGTLNAAGRIMIVLDKGWSADVTDTLGTFGRETRPPGKKVP